MSIRDFVLESFQQTLNSVLALDDHALQSLAQLHGRIVRVNLDGTGLSLHFIPGHDGRLQVLDNIEGEPDCTLSGSPFDLMRASDSSKGPTQLFAGNVTIDGDTATAQAFSTALSGLDIDWEEQLSHLTGDIAAHEIGRGWRAVARETNRISESSVDNLSEFLTEEARLLPHRFEVDAFLNDIDTLRDDVARLEARIALLQRRKEDDTS